jgi:general secretion pathway protein J
MVRSAAHPREAGFTLIEMLVTLAILGLVSSLFAGLLGSVAQVSARVERLRQDASVDAAQRVLRARIEALAPVVRTDSSDAIVDARGDTRMFSFAAPPPDAHAPAALQFYRLTLSPGGDLVLYSASTLNDRIDLRDPALTGWAPVRLLGNVARLDFAYYGPDRFSPEDRWQAFWIDRPQPPALVRIRLRLAEGDRRNWADLVVRPRATVNTVCRILRSSGRCEAL